MRIAVPRMSVLMLLGFILVLLVMGGWMLYAGAYGEPPAQRTSDSLAAPLVWAVFLILTIFFLLRELRSYPLTYTGGTYRVRRQTIRPGHGLLIGPITGVEGRHLCFSFRIYVKDFGSFRLRLRSYRTLAHLAVVGATDAHHICDETLTVYEADRSEESDRNANRIEADIPTGTQACYVVVQSGDATKAIRIRGRITLCARLREFFHLPTAEHFQECQIQEGSEPAEGEGTGPAPASSL